MIGPIDPAKHYVYHDPASPRHGMPVTQLHHFECHEHRPWRGMCGDWVFAFRDNDPYLREADSKGGTS